MTEIEAAMAYNNYIRDNDFSDRDFYKINKLPELHQCKINKEITKYLIDHPTNICDKFRLLPVFWRNNKYIYFLFFI